VIGRRLTGLVTLAVLAAAGCSAGDGPVRTAVSGASITSSSSATTTATSPPETAGSTQTSTAAPSRTGAGAGSGSTSGTATTATSPPVGPKEPTRVGAPAAGVLVTGAKGAAMAREPRGDTFGRLRAGVAVAYDAVDGRWARILTPCENRVWVKLEDGRVDLVADVVLDPGHGGSEPGAVGPAGLTEKELNLEVARETVDALRAEGIEAVLTRPSDYRTTIASRVAVAAALRPKAFVSIHHNAEPDGPRQGPGSETYYQIKSPESKRLAGLIYEEVVNALSAYEADWVADRDAGAKYRLNTSGTDYYGILRRAADAGLVASLAELGFLSNPSEEALLQRDDVRRAEAGALTRALVRFLRTDDPGSGFIEPYPRTDPAGPGGGTAGCVDPA
jgi:N-acetylmuramoyl-L-alanine amidase